MTWGEEEDLVEAYRSIIRNIRDTISQHFHRVKGAGGSEYYVGKIHSQRYYSLRKKALELLAINHEETGAFNKLKSLLKRLKEFGLDEMRSLGKAQWGCDSNHEVIWGPLWDNIIRDVHLALSS